MRLVAYCFFKFLSNTTYLLRATLINKCIDDMVNLQQNITYNCIAQFYATYSIFSHYFYTWLYFLNTSNYVLYRLVWALGHNFITWYLDVNCLWNFIIKISFMDTCCVNMLDLNLDQMCVSFGCCMTILVIVFSYPDLKFSLEQWEVNIQSRYSQIYCKVHEHYSLVE